MVPNGKFDLTQISVGMSWFMGTNGVALSLCGDELLVARQTNLHSFFCMAAAPKKRSLRNERRKAWATYVAFLIMRGSCCAHRTEDERLFYWREGHWPAPPTPGVLKLAH